MIFQSAHSHGHPIASAGIGDRLGYQLFPVASCRACTEAAGGTAARRNRSPYAQHRFLRVPPQRASSGIVQTKINDLTVRVFIRTSSDHSFLMTRENRTRMKRCPVSKGPATPPNPRLLTAQTYPPDQCVSRAGGGRRRPAGPSSGSGGDERGCRDALWQRRVLHSRRGRLLFPRVTELDGATWVGYAAFTVTACVSDHIVRAPRAPNRISSGRHAAGDSGCAVLAADHEMRVRFDADMRCIHEWTSRKMRMITSGFFNCLVDHHSFAGLQLAHIRRHCLWSTGCGRCGGGHPCS